MLVDAPYGDFAGRLEQARAALKSGAPAIFEASFAEGDIFVAVDVLERTQRNDVVWSTFGATPVDKWTGMSLFDGLLYELRYILRRAIMAPPRCAVFLRGRRV